ncbi:bifunctional diaminohydroxyphosphoribosylaminopyrimidine deaminase/5-amino-6-(5-phosphoribosylamino)uracil reductase RibD, partial [Rhodococcus chondri]
MTAPELAEALQFALDASEAVRGTTSPNPPVGAVILDTSGRIAGVGATAPPGGPHAEVRALAAAGERARGGTAVVTLEPCNHTGRTGPCTRALIDAGIATVYYAVPDPNPVAGGGSEALRAAGLTVHAGLGAEAVSHGPLRAWLHRQRTGRPHVTWKYAAGLDGRSAAVDGTSQWISGPESRARVHDHRSRLDAIIVGTGTVLADDPWLTARLPDGDLAP